MARLALLGDGPPRELRLGALTRIGRDPSADVHLEDAGVSWEHARVERRDGRFVVVDPGSRNGTFVNRRRVEGERLLEDGDELVVGTRRLFFTQRTRDDAASRVTLATPAGESIHQRLAAVTTEDDFRPADVIPDRAELARDYEKLRVAHALGRALATELDTPTVLERILGSALSLFGADSAAILLRGADGELELVASRSRVPSDAALVISRTIVQEAVSQRTAILAADARTDERFAGARSIVAAGIKATMTVPLVDGDEVLGVVYLDSRLATGAFGGKDLGLLVGFAHHATQALVRQRILEQRERDVVARGQLARLLAPPLVEQVMRGELDLVRGGALREASVLFSDIRGFTPMSERHPATEIVTLLNDYFDVMVEIVFRHGGTLDKFIGDAVMAIWGAPVGDDRHCQGAVAAALEMQAAVADFNATRAARAHPEIAVGIGVAAGELVAGFMGSTRAMGYTVIGDVVNTAARLCSIAGAGEVLVTDGVRARASQHRYEPMPARVLKGKSEPVAVFRVTGPS